MDHPTNKLIIITNFQFWKTSLWSRGNVHPAGFSVNTVASFPPFTVMVLNLQWGASLLGREVKLLHSELLNSWKNQVMNKTWQTLITTWQDNNVNFVHIWCTLQSDIFYACDKFMRDCQNGPLNKFMRFLFMHSSAYESNVLVWRNKNLCNINLCDLCLTHIIHK